MHTKTAARLDFLKFLSKANPFGRHMGLHYPQTSNAVRALAGAGVGLAVSDPLSERVAKYTLDKDDALTPVDRFTEKAINALVGGALAVRGGVIGNPHLGRTLSGKALLMTAPTMVHYLNNTLRNSSGITRNVEQASKELNAPLAGTDKPALRVFMESTGGFGQQMTGLLGKIEEKGPGAADRMEQIPANAAGKMVDRFGAGLSPLLGGVTGAAVGNLLGNVVAHRERTPEDIRQNDRRRALLTLALGGLGAGGGWALANPAAVGQGLDQARLAATNILSGLKQAFDKSDVDKLLPDDAGTVSDFLLFPSAQRRAGRARGLAESLGNDVPFHVNLPRTSRMLGALIGAGAGGAAGYGIGHQLDQKDGGGVENTVNGLRIGAALGGLSSLILDTIVRRRKVLEVKEQALDSMAHGAVPTPAIGKGNALAALVSGVHQQGRADTAEAIAHGRKHFPGNPLMTALSIASMVPYVGTGAGLAQGVGSVHNYMDSRQRMDGTTPTYNRHER